MQPRAHHFTIWTSVSFVFFKEGVGPSGPKFTLVLTVRGLGGASQKCDIGLSCLRDWFAF